MKLSVHRFFLKIGTKITLTFAGLFLIILLGAGFFLNKASTERTVTASFENIQNINRTKAENVKAFLRSEKEAIGIVATNAVFRDFLPLDPKTPEYAPKKQMVSRILDQSLLKIEKTEELFLLDKNGTIVVSTDTAKEGLDRSRDAYFTDAKNGVYVKNFYFSNTTKKNAYAISAPIKNDATGEFLGTIVARMSPEILYEMLISGVDLKKTGENFLIDQNAYFISPPRFLKTDVILKKKIGTQSAKDCFNPKINPSISTLDSSDGKILKKNFDYRGVPVIETYSFLPESNWCLITKIDVSEVLEPSDRLVNVFLTLGFFSVLFFLLAGYVMSRIIVGPIHALRRGAEIIKGGNLDYKVGTDKQDEVGELSRTFDEMTTAIKKTRREIDQKVKEQTEVIANKSLEAENQQKTTLEILEEVKKEKEKTELAARDLEKFKLAVDGASDHIVITDPDGIILYANRAVEKITGFSQEEVLGQKAGSKQNWGGLMEKSIYEGMWYVIKTYKNTFVGGLKNKRKNGEEYLVYANISPILDKDKNVRFFVGIERDVTEEKRQTEEITRKTLELEAQQKTTLEILEEVKKEKEKTELAARDLEKFKLAVDGASDHIVITDPDGIILYANKAVEKITGFSQEEVLGQKAGSLQNWGGLMEKNTYESLWYVIKTYKNTFVGGLKNKRKNGDRYDAFSSIIPIMDKDKNVRFFVGIERDVTKEKEIDRAKTEFVSLASHQLRTPLSSVNWYAEMLLAGDAGEINDEQKKYLKEIYDGNQRMVELVNSLLNVSRLDLGTFTVEPKPTNIPETAKSVLGELKQQIEKKHLVIKEMYAEHIPLFPADQKLLRIIFQNLLSNAVKYTRDSGTIALSVQILPKNTVFGGKEMTEEVLALSVSDTGMGIPEGQKDRVFSKLFRADNAQESESEGTGLGLYIIKSITDQSAGNIWFESEENNGTIFYVTFPSSGMKKKEGFKHLDETNGYHV
jgi:PAS domain S-box-containing protein